MSYVDFCSILVSPVQYFIWSVSLLGLWYPFSAELGVLCRHPDPETMRMMNWRKFRKAEDITIWFEFSLAITLLHDKQLMFVATVKVGSKKTRTNMDAQSTTAPFQQFHQFVHHRTFWIYALEKLRIMRKNWRDSTKNTFMLMKWSVIAWNEVGSSWCGTERMAGCEFGSRGHDCAETAQHTEA